MKNLSVIIFFDGGICEDLYCALDSINMNEYVKNVFVFNRTDKNISYKNNKTNVINTKSSRNQCIKSVLDICESDFLAIIRADLLLPEYFFDQLFQGSIEIGSSSLYWLPYPKVVGKDEFVPSKEKSKITTRKISDYSDENSYFVLGFKKLFDLGNCKLQDYFIFRFFFYKNAKSNYLLSEVKAKCHCTCDKNYSENKYNSFCNDKALAKQLHLLKKRSFIKAIVRIVDEPQCVKVRLFGIKFKFSKKSKFNKKAIDVDREISHVASKTSHGLVTIVAMFRKNCDFSDNVISYLQELKKYSDYIICVGDNPILEKELQKLSGVVDYAIFTKHSEYDFGSYKRGYEKLKQLNILTDKTRLLLCNDSIEYNTNRSLENIFSKSQEYDCMGLTINNYCFSHQDKKLGPVFEYLPHIQSYFVFFSANIATSQWFSNFITSVDKENDKLSVIKKYEVGLSRLLTAHNVKLNSYYDYDDKLSITPLLIYLNSKYKNYEFYKHSLENEELP